MFCKCGKKAVYHRKYEGTYLCKEHFIKSIERRAKHTLRKYGLGNNERLAIALSGGKDSSALLFFINKLFRNVRGIDFFALTIDEGIAGYRDKSILLAKRLCERLGIRHYIFSFKEEFGLTLDEKVKDRREYACTYCGVARRWLLNKKARELGATRLVTAHNLDDEVQSVIMDYLRGDLSRLSRAYKYAVMHKLFVQRVKPFKEIPEREIALYALLNGIEIQEEKCPYARGMRFVVKKFLNELEEESSGIKFSAYRTGVKISRVIATHLSKKVMYSCAKCNEPSVNRICKTCELWR